MSVTAWNLGVSSIRGRTTNDFSLVFYITFSTLALSLIFVERNHFDSLKGPSFGQKISKNEGGSSVQNFE